MNLDALKHIVQNDPSYIEELVGHTQYDSASTLGVAKLLLGNGGNAEALTGPQRFHYTRFIRPLLEDVPCSGVMDDPDTCTGNGLVDDESLLMSYQEGTFLCQHCRYDRDKMHGDKS